jgi:rubrerythrin
MSARGCLKELKPNSAWQCLECCTVHGDDLDDDDDVDCPVCGVEAVCQDDEEFSTTSRTSSTDSMLVDDERSNSSSTK